jgi:Zn-dependent protease
MIITSQCKTGVGINLVLAIFNLVPIPPLDGSRFVLGVLPYPAARFYAGLEPYGMIIIFLLLYFGVLNSFVWPVVEFLAHLLGA